MRRYSASEVRSQEKAAASPEFATFLRNVGHAKFQAVMDIHQPLHAANDADRGGNCIRVDSHPRAEDLHAAWDTTIVRRLEHSIDSGRPEATAHKLEQTYATEKVLDAWIPGHTDDVAWESNQIARSGIYAALRLPVEPCEPAAALCSNEPEVDLTLSTQPVAGPIIGNRRSKIYAWPGCGSYDRMVPQNRVVFPSREAAEQAGYRVAYSCP